MMRVALILCLVVATLAHGQSSRYARVKIYGDQEAIARLGITLDHLQIKQDESITGVFSAYELSIIRQSGLFYEIIAEDATLDYLTNVQHKAYDRSGREACSGTTQLSPLDTITVPQDFSLGTMGGFFKYEEMLAHLDNMAAKYPDLISVRKGILNPETSSDFQTHQSRIIYYVKISDHVNEEEGDTETQILYTALHHAREPGSLSQLVFYMYYLLENYGKNTWVTHLVNNREMFFVPCVNPDGYVYNQTTNPNGGGMWRKNRRANGGGSYGVDLNRNYSYQWGVSGTSSDPNSDVYKGPSPFSEPETQAIRALCKQFNFKMAFNYHSHGDLLLFPFGYANVQTPDHTRYTRLTQEMVLHNNYVNEQSVLLYPAAGDSDDYMYGNTTDKPRIFAMTPEIGNDFWIAQSAILPLCKETLWQNISMALQADAYPSLKSLDASLDATTGTLTFTVEGRGLNSLHDVELLVVPKTAALSTGTASGIGTLTPFQVKTVTVPYTVAENTPNGTLLDFVCTVAFNDGKTLDYPLRLVWKGGNAISGEIIFADDFTTLDQWATTGTWGLTTTSFTSGPTAITDSPEGTYNNYVNMKIDTREVIDLTGIQTAYLTFKARWSIETDDDYLQVTVVRNNIEYPVCGNYSRVNKSGRIVYDGNQNSWVNEQINLADFLGQQIKLRFRFKSDGSGTADGFFLDDIAVVVIAHEDHEPPDLESIEPAHNAIVGIDQEIKLRFSENIILQHASEVVLKRTEDQAPVESEIYASGHELIIKPVSLDYSTQYYLDISASAIADLNGNYVEAMSSEDWMFSTAPPPDEVPPQVTTLLPLPGATDVLSDVKVRAQFNEPIIVHADLVRLVNDQDQEIPADVAVVDQTTLTLSPQQNLDSGSTYSIILSPGSVEDLYHNAFEGLPSAWTFTTRVITGMEKFDQISYKVFPNPMQGKARMVLPDVQTVTHIRLVHATGGVTQVAWKRVDKNLVEFELDKPRSGIYLLQVHDATGVHVVKLCIE